MYFGIRPELGGLRFHGWSPKLNWRMSQSLAQNSVYEWCAKPTASNGVGSMSIWRWILRVRKKGDVSGLSCRLLR
jgi:hypothetical protein